MISSNAPQCDLSLLRLCEASPGFNKTLRSFVRLRYFLRFGLQRAKLTPAGLPRSDISLPQPWFDLSLLKDKCVEVPIIYLRAKVGHGTGTQLHSQLYIGKCPSGDCLLRGAHTMARWEILCFALCSCLGAARAATVSTRAFLRALQDILFLPE